MTNPEARGVGKQNLLVAKRVGYTVAGSLTLVASPSGRQSAEFLRNASGFVD
jgi:hypothetical protein